MSLPPPGGDSQNRLRPGHHHRDGIRATVKLQVNRLVSWMWIGEAKLRS